MDKGDSWKYLWQYKIINIKIKQLKKIEISLAYMYDSKKNPKLFLK